jgi:hypothetical protein
MKPTKHRHGTNGNQRTNHSWTKKRKQPARRSALRSTPAVSSVIAALLADPARRDEFFAKSRDLTDAKGLRDLAAAIAGAEATNESIVELLAFFVNQQVLSELISNGYLTNDIVEIYGGFDRNAFRELRVNGRSVRLDRSQYLLLRTLVRHARKNWRRNSRLQSDSERFLPVDEILREIDRLKAAHPKLGDVWNDATFTTIHHVVGKLRDKLTKAKLNKFLLESGPGGAGYRISTRPGNITLHPGNGEKPAA